MSLPFSPHSARRASKNRTHLAVLAAARCACESLEQRRLLDGIVGGTKYEDSNGNGVIDASDTPMPGVTIYADLNNNGVRDFNDPSTITDAAGAYRLQLVGTQVTLREETPAGYDVVLPAGGSATVNLSPTGVPTVNWLDRRRLDWGDAPDGSGAVLYPTLAAHNGARAQVLPGYSLGAKIDAEPDGQPNANATGDDLAGVDDEDGVTFLTPLVSGTTATVEVDFTSTAGLTGVLDAWIDFNGNKSWEAAERVATTFVLTPGANILSFSVPAAAISGDTFARFRLSPNGVQTPDGTGFITAGPTFPVAGEVEDYQIRIEPGQQLDWGDAPDTAAAPGYPTLASHNGARHEILPGFSLGGKLDAEPDGQPNSTATGDDLNGSADEDGVTFSALNPGAAASATVFLTAPAGTTAILDAWIDFNRDGDWADPGEQIATNVPLTPGSNNVPFSVPNTANPGPTFARFRLAQTAADVTSYDGFGGKGEVEDYNPRINQVVSGNLDWGDAPVTPGGVLQYPTLASQNGARHLINTGFHLGNLIDAEADGQPTLGANGDDTNGPDDEDGVVFLDPLIPGSPARVQVTLFNSSGGQGRLDAWMDFNADGVWSGAVERVATAFLLNPGPNILIVNVPLGAATGLTYSRFRLSLQGGLPVDGFGGTGEVEDYPIAIRNRQNRKLDWGDAPDATPAGPGYPTLASSNGARHTVRPGFYLGARADAEPDGQPNATATGDDTNGVPNDEDGVTFLTPITPGGVATIQVVAPLGGVLDAWIDFAADFSWAQPGDRIATAYALSPGVNVLNVPVPAGAKLGLTYARFRLSENGVASYDGFGGNGEVEDYRLTIQSRGQLDFGDAPKSYQTLLADNGARNTVRPGLTLGALIDAEPDGQPSPNADKDDSVGVDDEDGVTLVGGFMTAGQIANFNVVASAAGFLDAWVDLNMNGSFGDPGEHVISGAVVAGNNPEAFPVPAGTPAGDTYARFRYALTPTPSYFGFGGDGETEDYKFAIKEGDNPNPHLDWGDAPDPMYPTLAVNNGARHSYQPGFTLGYRWDAEPNGQPQPQALGDDFAGIDDEDGVKFLTPLIRGNVALVQVIAPAGGVLDAWMDFNADGDWADPGEQIATSFPLVPGVNILPVPVPAGPNIAQRTFSRFRLSANGGLSYTGFGGIGEVEDYINVINGPTTTFDPATGTLHTVGTPGKDQLYVRLNPQTNMFEIGDNSQSGMPPDFSIDADLVQGMDFDLGEGDDWIEIDLPLSTKAGSSGTIERLDFSISGDAGDDWLTVDGSGLTDSVHAVLQQNRLFVGGLSMELSSMEDRLIEGGMADDTFLLLPGASDGSDPKPSVTIGGGPGDDEFHVVDSFFDIFTELSIIGGSQSAGGMGDCLALFGDGSNVGNYMPAGGMSDSGMVVVDGMPINFTGLEPVEVSSFARFELDMPAGVSGNDAITFDAESNDFGDTSIVSGTSNGTGFEQAELTDVGTFILNAAGNDSATVGASNDVVTFLSSVSGAGSFRMPVGKATLTLNVIGGSIPIGWDPGSLGAPVTVNVAGGAAVNFGSTQHLAALSIAAAGNATLDSNGSRVLVTKALSVSGSGQLDLTNNGMIVDYNGATPAPAIRALLISGRNGGTWNGSGIMTSSAPLLAGSALGYFDNAVPQLSSFMGENTDPTSVLIRYTYVGDGNLDQTVDIKDLYLLGSNWQLKNRGWAGGDFDYNDITNASDLGLLSSKWQQTVPPPVPAVPVGFPKAPARKASRVTDVLS